MKDTITYSEVKQSVFTNTQASEPEYEVITRDHKPTDYDAKMDTDPAYQVTNQLQSQMNLRNSSPDCVSFTIYIEIGNY